MRMRGLAGIVVVLVVAVTEWAGVAHASLFQQQQRLLRQGCRAAVPLIENMLNEAATTRILSIQTQVQVLWPGELTGDIVFNPSGTAVNAAADPRSIVQENFRCGHISSGHGRVGARIPRRHVVAVVQATFTSAGLYTLTFWLNQKGRRILAGLAAAERRYHKHHPHRRRPPTITWGIGLHFVAGG
jgi:hypothetical protein